MKNPAFFRGTHRRKSYFEGWYFKCISADRKHALAFIPGIAIEPDGSRHSFVQVIDAAQGKTWYYNFPINEFSAGINNFAVTIGQNHFADTGLRVDLADGSSIRGELAFTDIRPYPVSRFHPSIMGPFYFIPFMECYHAIIHLAHSISGKIVLDGETLDFTGGTGYIEKDYGRSFPRTYVWLQAGHFDKTDASFVLSRARIPFLGSEFPGFFAYFTDFKNIAVRFATYNRSRIEAWQVDKEAGTVSGKLTGRHGNLVFTARMSGGGVLRAPAEGQMEREIIESIAAEVEVQLYNQQGQLIFEDKSSRAGMEISL